MSQYNTWFQSSETQPSPPKQQQQQQQQQQPYQQQPPHHALQHSRSYSHSASAQSPSGPFFQPAYQPEPQSATTQTFPSSAYHQPHQPQQALPNLTPFSSSAYQQQQQQPAYPSAYQPPYAPPHQQRQHTYGGQPSYDSQHHDRDKDDGDDDGLTIHVKHEQPHHEPSSSAMPPPAVEPSPVKTKFPMARIKRIMQNDDDVGKVAQQTPIAVGKALEMFMVQLVTKSAEIARDKNSKRVTPAMLKTVIETDDQWDFLREIASKVEPDKEGAGGASKGKAAATAKAETDSDDDEEEEEEEQPKPVRKRGGRKRKSTA